MVPVVEVCAFATEMGSDKHKARINVITFTMLFFILPPFLIFKGRLFHW